MAKKSVAKPIVLPTGESMIEPDDDGYKYLGILELDDIMTKEMKEKVRTYFKRLKLLLRSKLNEKTYSLR